MNPVIVRVPPSPTGLLHVGTARTMLYNYLFAKKEQGQILMRMEDTDRERSRPEYEENILSGLKRLGLSWDGTVLKQSERTALYRKYLEQLLVENKAYWCFCTKEELDAERMKREAEKLPPRYSGKCAALSGEEQKQRLENGEKGVIRFRLPVDQEIVFQDRVRGEVRFNSRDLDDFVIAKNLDEPLYNFCVVIDDHETNVTHVIRGEDHISNTPKQMLIFQAFGWKIPEFSHLPLILNADKSKLSKRKNKVSVDDYLADGILPEALLNFLALVGWNPGDTTEEIFTLEELIEKFSLERVHKGGAVFDLEKLLWLNGMWIRRKTIPEFKKLAEPYLATEPFLSGRKKYGEAFLEKALLLIQERCKKLSEIPDLIRFFFTDELEYSSDLYSREKMKVDREISIQALRTGIDLLKAISETDWVEEHLKELLLAKVTELDWKNGQLLWPLRVALSGEEFSPGTFELLATFGKERSLERLESGLKKLS